jgi:integrase
LEHRLPARAKLAEVQHHPALPFVEIGDFMAALAKHEGTSARALELTILTATRTSEALKATWGEFDLEAKVWTIPAARMKAGREHRVPLSDAAVAVLLKMRPAAPAGKDRKPLPSAYVFPGQSRGKPLSNMSMLKLLERMKRTDLTVHGFRSTFSDWAGETATDRFSSDLVEMALAHVIKSKVRAAYQRGDQLEPRRELMAAWATACATPRPASAIKPLEEAA